jgi:hypothetical protein
MKLIYTPIDIPCKIPDEEKVLKWFHNNHLLDTDYWEYSSGRHQWAMTSTSSPPKDWRRYDPEMWDNRRVDQKGPVVLFINPSFELEFPEISNVLRQLPFKQLSVSGMLYQIGEIPLHSDTYDPREPTEPRRYTIYLTDPDYCTFYFDNDGEKVVPKINKDYCCFAFNNNDIKHGAFKIDREKVIITCAGILDNDKHTELLSRSISKFKDELIYL